LAAFITFCDLTLQNVLTIDAFVILLFFYKRSLLACEYIYLHLSYPLCVYPCDSTWIESAGSG